MKDFYKPSTHGGNKMKKKLILWASVLFVFTSFLAISCATASAKPQISLWATSKEGTAGFEFGLSAQKVLNPYLKEYNIKIENRSSPGSQASQRMVSEGMVGACWQSSYDLVQTYQQTGPYKKQPVWNPPHLTFFPRVTGIYFMTLADRDDIKTLSDLAGKKVYVRFRGSSVHDMTIAMLEALGILDDVKVNDSTAPMRLADGLKSGEIEVVAFSGGFAGVGLKADMLNIDARCDMKYIAPTEEEKEKLKSIPGLAGISGKPMSFTKDIGTDNIWGMAYAYGIQFSNREPAETVYMILKGMYEHWDEITKITKVAPYFGDDPEAKEYNQSYLDSLVKAGGKVHPGAAKLYKEIGWWKEGWPIGEIKE